MTGPSDMANAEAGEAALQIRDLSVALPAWADRTLAVSSVSLTVKKGRDPLRRR